MHSRLCALALVSLVSLTAGCRSSGGSFLVFGGSAAPQEELVARVQGARQEAGEAEEDFAAAFMLYQRLTTPQAVELEDLADDYADALERCQERAEELDERIATVGEEAEELFAGWNEELTRFSSDTLRAKSAAMLADTQARTERVLAALTQVDARMDPLVRKLEDYALFFNHNLNARAIATLEDTYKDFDSEYRALAAELASAQQEMAAFLAAFEEPAAE
jgi:chromosome segregation ATPase